MNSSIYESESTSFFRQHFTSVIGDPAFWGRLWCLTPLSTFFQLYRGGQFNWWRKSEYPKNTTDLSQVSQNIVWSSIHSIQWSIFFKLLRKCPSWGKPLIPMFRCGNGDILLSTLPLSHRLGIVFYSVWFFKYQFNILRFLPVYCIPKIVSRYNGFEFLLFIVTW